MSKILNKLAEIQSRLIAFDCRLDAHIRNDAQGDRWITTETGSHIKLNEAGAVVGGAGGKLNGKFYGVDKTSEARHTENKSNSGSGENKMETRAVKVKRVINPLGQETRIFHRDDLPANAKYQEVSSTVLQPYVQLNYKDGIQTSGQTRTSEAVDKLIAASKKAGWHVDENYSENIDVQVKPKANSGEETLTQIFSKKEAEGGSSAIKEEAMKILKKDPTRLDEINKQLSYFDISPLHLS